VLDLLVQCNSCASFGRWNLVDAGMLCSVTVLTSQSQSHSESAGAMSDVVFFLLGTLEEPIDSSITLEDQHLRGTLEWPFCLRQREHGAVDGVTCMFWKGTACSMTFCVASSSSSLARTSDESMSILLRVQLSVDGMMDDPTMGLQLVVANE